MSEQQQDPGPLDAMVVLAVTQGLVKGITDLHRMLMWLGALRNGAVQRPMLGMDPLLVNAILRNGLMMMEQFGELVINFGGEFGDIEDEAMNNKMIEGCRSYSKELGERFKVDEFERDHLIRTDREG